MTSSSVVSLASARSGGAVRYGTDEYRALIDAIGVSARAAKREGRSLHGTIDLVRAARLGALRVPVAEGGGGASLRELYATLIDLAAADPDVPHILRAHYWFTEERLRTADPVVRRRWLDRIVAGDIVGNAMSELGGSAAVGAWAFTTRLERRGERYALNGTKYYCTGSLYSDWVTVYASGDDGNIASATVPVTRAGVDLKDDWDGMGQRHTGSGTGVFTDVVVEPEELLTAAVESQAGAVADPADPYLAGQVCQLILTAIIAGILRNVQSDAIALVRNRGRTYSHAAGATPADDPLLQQVVGEIASGAFAAEALVLAAADAQDAALATHGHGTVAFDAAHRASVLAAQAKVVVDETATRVAAQLFDVGGSAAVKASADFDRHWRNVRTLASHNPTPYKARAVGAWLLKDERLPNSGFF